jgi:hypothetical protein
MQEREKQEREKNGVGRRDFLRVLGAGAGAAAATAAPLATSALAVESDTDKKKARYRESEEVKTYYRVNRYPPKAK